MTNSDSTQLHDFGHRRLVFELTNICNLHCAYCFRSDEDLYHSPTQFLSAEFLEQTCKQARTVMGLSHVVFTGGEPTLHPEFSRLLRIIDENGLKLSFVTNGWHFERIWPAILEHRAVISMVAFSLDGTTAADHDRWRGEGSFVRLVRAFARCHAGGIPFAAKVCLRRDTIGNLEQVAIFCARLGAHALSFAHVMPTSDDVERNSALTFDERREAEQEIASLARILKMKVAIDVGYYNIDPSPPCSPLAKASANIDFRGRLTLCCNLSGYRGAEGKTDILADLNTESFGQAYQRLCDVAEAQLEARRRHLASLVQQNAVPDLYSGSPCLFCLQSLGKIPWHQNLVEPVANRELPVLQLN